jgi:hypothetical protein
MPEIKNKGWESRTIKNPIVGPNNSYSFSEPKSENGEDKSKSFNIVHLALPGQQPRVEKSSPPVPPPKPQKQPQPNAHLVSRSQPQKQVPPKKRPRTPEPQEEGSASEEGSDSDSDMELTTEQIARKMMGMDQYD